VQRLVALAEGKAHVALALVAAVVERARRDGRDADAGGQVAAGLDVVAEPEAADAGAEEIGAGRGPQLEARGDEGRGEQVTLAPVVALQLIVIGARSRERGDGGMLQRRRGREGHELVGRADRRGQRGVGHRPADPPAGEREGLAQAG
jgi:hypothetical protein